VTPAPHTLPPIVGALVLGGLAVVLWLGLPNRVIRQRMVFTLLVVAAMVALHFAGDYGLLGTFAEGRAIEGLLLTLAVINTLVALLFNPWFSDRVLDRAPAIVQDALVLGTFLLAGIFVYQRDVHVFATSAIAAAVLGFALQETLGNAFAGLAIQVEKPFRVGHWITVGSYEGTVREVTWRATKIWTKAGNMVILPNSLVAREAINNFSEPLSPTRLHVDIGVGYQVPPNEARAALVAALGQAPRVLTTPPPDPQLWDFAPSALLFRVFFWIDDYAAEEQARDEVRRAIYYELGRRRIEIPYPIQVEYGRQDPPAEPDEARVARVTPLIARVPVLAALFTEGHRALAEDAREQRFGVGEIIVREGEPGDSMFVVCSGEVAVRIGKDREVARIRAGGYFGEMSLLTGELRTATVVACAEVVVLEIGAATFKAYITTHPQAIDHLAAAAADRRRELDASRAAGALDPKDSHRSLADRMRRFFGLKAGP
jgi:small-conductance mechanosensitive channel/CRP-like cAMP-binding protein